MIKITLRRNADGFMWAFEAENHGGHEACAAVSMLLINTVNSIKAFTDAEFDCDYNKKGGSLKFYMPLHKKNGCHRDANLLLEAMALGINDTQKLYPKDVKVTNVQ
ncbi:MAG: ribosomal-processing cysteine protease Prp [Defluviitaleaceae bacterium]|nr:ribosomal-processing cysteine protease Prp [Defluviitaleaceae bacterium]